jgi:long-chain acyl-CoA synthetase
MVRSIVRPSIVESAMSYPFPGWNEGFTTTAPIIFLIRKGQTQIPADPKLILDITPVDQVASVMLAVSAQACVEEPQLVFRQPPATPTPTTWNGSSVSADSISEGTSKRRTAASRF